MFEDRVLGEGLHFRSSAKFCCQQLAVVGGISRDRGDAVGLLRVWKWSAVDCGRGSGKWERVMDAASGIMVLKRSI